MNMLYSKKHFKHRFLYPSFSVSLYFVFLSPSLRLSLRLCLFVSLSRLSPSLSLRSLFLSLSLFVLLSPSPFNLVFSYNTFSLSLSLTPTHSLFLFLSLFVALCLSSSHSLFSSLFLSLSRSFSLVTRTPSSFSLSPSFPPIHAHPLLLHSLPLFLLYSISSLITRQSSLLTLFVNLLLRVLCHFIGFARLINRVLTTRLVQWLSWPGVLATQKRKKERFEVELMCSPIVSRNSPRQASMVTQQQPFPHSTIVISRQESFWHSTIIQSQNDYPSHFAIHDWRGEWRVQSNYCRVMTTVEWWSDFCRVVIVTRQ